MLLFLLLLMLLGLGLSAVSGIDGALLLEWRNTRLEATPLGAAALLSLVAVAGWACIAALRGLFALPRRSRALARRRSTERGLAALNASYLALAKGDLALAGRHQRQAERHLPHIALPLLLGAQVAIQENDPPRQHELLEQMLAIPESRALAARSLLAEALARDDLPQAQNWAQQALEADPKDAEIQKLRIHLLLRQRAFSQAHDQLHHWRMRRQSRKPLLAEMEGLVAVTEGREALARRDYAAAMRFLQQAMKWRGSWLPALIPLAEAAHALHQQTEVKKLVEKHWRHAPHPRLSELHRQALGTLAPHTYLKDVQGVTRGQNERVESMLWLAQAAERAADWNLAREYAQAAVLIQPCREAHTLLAQLEQRLTPHLPAASLEQKAKAANAAPLTWICQRCSAPSDQWHLACPVCHTPESLEWNAAVSPSALALR